MRVVGQWQPARPEVVNGPNGLGEAHEVRRARSRAAAAAVLGPRREAHIPTAAAAAAGLLRSAGVPQLACVLCEERLLPLPAGQDQMHRVPRPRFRQPLRRDPLGLFYMRC